MPADHRRFLGHIQQAARLGPLFEGLGCCLFYFFAGRGVCLTAVLNESLQF